MKQPVPNERLKKAVVMSLKELIKYFLFGDQ